MDCVEGAGGNKGSASQLSQTESTFYRGMRKLMKAFEKFCEGGRKFNKQRTLAQLNLQDEKENYALGGPTFDLQN